MMLKLSEVIFDYDFFSSPMPDGSTLVLNKVSELLASDDGDVGIKGINIVIIDGSTGENILCSSVIGMGNGRINLVSAHEEQLGKVLTEDNMQYCEIEMLEENDE